LAEKVAWIMSRPQDAEKPPSQSLASVADPLNGLGTHPDLVARLWKLNEALPEDSRWVVYGRPALVHPVSGVIFAYATGTVGYAIRLPRRRRDEADRLGSRSRIDVPGINSYNLALAGCEWRFGQWLDQEADWCRAAYEHASGSGEPRRKPPQHHIDRGERA
jgi:hypothetical protein